MDYAIGDVHGCRDKLERLLELIRYDPAADRLIFLGDYLDRGPDSRGVIELLLRLQAENPANVFLMGNHEENFLTFLRAWTSDEGMAYWLAEPFLAGGGLATLHSYCPGLRHPFEPRLLDAIPPQHLQFLSNLRLYWTDETYIAVHAGVRPGIPLPQQTTNDLLRIRGPFLARPHGLGKCVIFGHTPFRDVLRQADKIGIDTGACYAAMGYGKLTALCLQTQQAWQVT
ncbi:MAG: ser/threonine protein phosphatase [Candidatus Tectimicrobiota bacterium]|nr:MAG: ser/threonine protein phosphatase [Candidatus Tectomicrobia bacterium]